MIVKDFSMASGKSFKIMNGRGVTKRLGDLSQWDKPVEIFSTTLSRTPSP